MHPTEYFLLISNCDFLPVDLTIKILNTLLSFYQIIDLCKSDVKILVYYGKVCKIF